MIANTYRQSSFPDLKIRQIASVEPRVSWDWQSAFFECLRENCESARIWRCLAVEGSKGRTPMARDLTPRPQRWLQWGERPVADRGGVQSHNLHLESHDVAGVSALGRMTGKGRISSFRKRAGRSGIVKGFRTPARRRRGTMHGGRRPKSLEGGNRGEVCAGGGVRLWGFSGGVCCDFSILNGEDWRVR
jgi:hypothetical protein